MSIFNLFSEPFIHLSFGHFAIVLPIVALGLQLLMLRLPHQSLETLSLSLTLLGAASIWPVYYTGEGSASIVKNFPGVSPAAIAEHEWIADFALFASFCTSALSIYLLFVVVQNRPYPKSLKGIWLTTLVALIVVVSYTAHHGFMVHHEEFRSL